MEKSLLFTKITKYWLIFTIIYILMCVFIISGNIYFLLFNILGVCIATYFKYYLAFKENKDKTSSSKLLKTYLIIFLILVFLSTTTFRGHHLSLSFKNWNLSNVNVIPLQGTFEDIKAFFTGADYTNFTLILGNIFLLVPLAYLYPRNIKNNKFYKTILACFLTSFSLEIFQFVFNVGAFDIDDIILNTTGPVLFYPLFNKSSISKIMDNIFYFKKEKLAKKDWLALAITIIFFLGIFYILIYDYWFKKPGYGVDVYKETPCINSKTFAFEDEFYKYYYACSNNDDLYIEYTQDFLGFDVKTKYKIVDLISGKVNNINSKDEAYLNNEYIIKESKYSSLEIKTLNNEEINFNLSNANIKLNNYKIIGYNDDTYYYYFIIPNNAGITNANFILTNEESNTTRYLEYQITVNKDLTVEYQEIN